MQIDGSNTCSDNPAKRGTHISPNFVPPKPVCADHPHARSSIRVLEVELRVVPSAELAGLRTLAHARVNLRGGPDADRDSKAFDLLD